MMIAHQRKRRLPRITTLEQPCILVRRPPESRQRRRPELLRITRMSPTMQRHIGHRLVLLRMAATRKATAIAPPAPRLQGGFPYTRTREQLEVPGDEGPRRRPDLARRPQGRTNAVRFPGTTKVTTPATDITSQQRSTRGRCLVALATLLQIGEKQYTTIDGRALQSRSNSRVLPGREPMSGAARVEIARVCRSRITGSGFRASRYSPRLAAL
jgi:hypothetical protein